MKNIQLSFLILLLCLSNINSQFSYNNCDDLQDSDFTLVPLISVEEGGVIDNLQQPIQMDFDAVMQGDSVTHVNIYFVEKRGVLKFYNAAAQTVTEIGTLDVDASADRGLTGIALDPDFKTNSYIYLYWAPGAPDGTPLRLSRFTLSAQNTLDVNTEKVLIEFEGNTAGPHQGGPMTFDKDGNLLFVVGNDSPDQDAGGFSHVSLDNPVNSDLSGAGNTASFRGSIVRIHIDESDPKGYTIPPGNFGEHWAGVFMEQGEMDLAAEYSDPAKVFPEIYSKGHRSNFSVSTDPLTGWVTWGEVGPWRVRNPDGGIHKTEEFNITTHPVFGGYPFFTGEQMSTGGHDQTPEAPMNLAPFNTGVQQLPPAAMPSFAYGSVNGDGIVGITGPVYRYDPALKSAVKMPPHFDGYWFAVDYHQDWMQAMKLAPDGESILSADTLWDNLDFHRILDFHQGPDGAFYLLGMASFRSSENRNQISRIEYTGDCRPVLVAAPFQKSFAELQTSGKIKIIEPGTHQIHVYDLKGQELIALRGDRPRSYDLSLVGGGRAGMLVVKVVTAQGVFQGKILKGR